MKQFKAQQYTPQHGDIIIYMRFNKKEIYLKCNNSPQKNAMIKQLRNNGASIEESSAGWLKIDIFGTNERVKLGPIEFDVKKTPVNKIELLLYYFFVKKYEEAHYKVVEGER